MKALHFHRHGDLDVLEYGEVPDPPSPGKGEVLLKVEAVSLNRVDIFVRKGWPSLKLEMPHWGGADVVGRIEEVGEKVEGWRVGDRVVVYPDFSCGRCRACRRGEVPRCPSHRLLGEHMRGGAAELLVVPSSNLFPLPSDFPSTEAAAAPVTFLTAWRMLVTRSNVRPGETVLILGAGGGVNTACTQIAKLCGARVLVAAGGEEKGRKALEIGADEVCDYRKTDVVRWVNERTGGEGADVVVDNVGASTWLTSLKAVARGGRIAVVGGTTGYDPPASLAHIFWKEITIVGSTMGTWEEFQKVMTLVWDRKLRPVVGRVLPLDQGKEGVRLLEEGRVFGKVVLVP